MSSSIIDSIRVLYFRDLLTSFVFLIELIISHCLKNLPDDGFLFFVRLLCIWHNSQEFCLKWSTFTSVYFKISNGVRQGGILSPRLFSLYTDDLGTLLADTQVGCYIDSSCVNHFFYADDMSLLAPSAIGPYKLIGVCQQYGVVLYTI